MKTLYTLFPLCAAGVEAKQRVVVNARRLGKTRMAGEQFQLSMSRRFYDLLQP
jgi:hypothetical protein